MEDSLLPMDNNWCSVVRLCFIVAAFLAYAMIYKYDKADDPGYSNCSLPRLNSDRPSEETRRDLIAEL